MGIMNLFNRGQKKEEHPYTTAIIAAAGNGSRMGLGFKDKQLILINGTPVISYSIRAFEDATTIDEIIIVSKEENILRFADLVKDFEFKKVSKIICGGQTRTQSVFNAINELDEKTRYISIHDGARPFVNSNTINEVNYAAYKYNAAACYVKIKDTIKNIDNAGFVKDTIDRTYLGAVQTPQAFSLKLYLACSSLAQQRGINYSDDCQIIEQGGKKVYLIEGSYNNIKITTKEDIALAEALQKAVNNV